MLPWNGNCTVKKRSFYLTMYVPDLLEKICMLRYKPANTSMDHTTKLGSMEGHALWTKTNIVDLWENSYLSHTRPYVCFFVSMVSQSMNNLTEEHPNAVYQILCYLKMTPSRGLHFKWTTKRGIDIFIDADWASSITDRRFTSQYCTYVWRNLVNWQRNNQL